MWGGEVSFSLSNDAGVLLEGQGFTDYATTEGYFCLDDTAGCLVLTMADSFGDGWNGATLTVTVPSEDLNLGTFTLAEGALQAITFGLDCETEEVQIEGYRPFAFNYDPTATVDDGSCSTTANVRTSTSLFVRSTTSPASTPPSPMHAKRSAPRRVIAEGDCDEVPVYGCTDECPQLQPRRHRRRRLLCGHLGVRQRRVERLVDAPDGDVGR